MRDIEHLILLGSGFEACRARINILKLLLIATKTNVKILEKRISVFRGNTRRKCLEESKYFRLENCSVLPSMSVLSDPGLKSELNENVT